MKIKKISDFVDKNFITTVITSYLIIVAMMLIVLFCVLGVYSRYYASENEAYNNYVFNNITITANDVVRDMNNAKIEMLQNTRITNLLNNVSDDIFMNVDVYDVVDDLKKISNLNENIDMCFIYLSDIDCVLYGGGVLESKLFYEMWIDNEKISYKKWKNAIDRNDEYALISGRGNDGKNTEYLSQRFRIPANGKNIAVVMSNKNNMMSALEKDDWEKGYKIYIFNPYGRLVVTNAPNDENLPSSVVDILKNHPSDTAVFQNERIIANNKWQTVVTIPKAELLSTMRMIRFIVAVIVICGIILLIIIIVYLVKHNYYPVKQVFELLDITKNEQQLNVVYDRVEAILNQNKFLAKDTERNKRNIKAGYLTSLLKGTYFNHDTDFEFKGQNFQVVMFEIDDISTFFSDAVLSEDERHYHLNYIIENVISEKLNEIGASAYFVAIDNRYVCIVNTVDDLNEEAVFNSIRSGTDFINANFKINVYFSTSYPCNTKQGLVLAYNQSAEVMDYICFYRNYASLSYHDFVKKLDCNELIFNKKIFCNFLKNGYKKNASETVETLFKYISTHQNLPISQIKFTAMQIAEMCHSLDHADLDNEIFVVNNGNKYSYIKNAKHIDEVKNYLLSSIVKVCDEITHEISKVKHRNHVKTNDIVKYINDNFTDKNMNINAVANYFGITPNYLTKIFKKEINTPMLDYINFLRIERANELMSEGNIKFEQALEMAGFSNERTYFRVKKKFKDTDAITIDIKIIDK